MKYSQVLREHEVVAAPGAYDALSARLIQEAGFPLVYVSGLANEASDLGYPDLGFTTATEMAGRAAKMVQVVDRPVVCDADTGFGGAGNVVRTVREFEMAGVSAIHLEDQSFPKRCGLLDGKSVVSPEAFCQTIATAVSARRSESLEIIARTDAKGTDGVDGVVRRLCAYAEAGASALMLGDFYALDDYARIAASVPLPLVACAVDRHNYHQQRNYSLAEWQAAGVKMVVYWHLPLFSALAAVRRSLQALHADGTTAGVESDIAGYRDYAAATDLETWQALNDSDQR